MRRVADQRQPLRNERARHKIAERKRARLVERLDLAEVQAEALLQLRMEFIRRQRHDARGIGARLGPYQRRAFSRQRQDRKRTRGQEVLLGAAVVIALMADGDDDAGLVVFPAMGRDPGAFAQSRLRPIGRHQQARRDGGALAQRHGDAIGLSIISSHTRGAQIDAFGLRALHQRIDQMPIFDHVREGFAGFDVACEGQECRTGCVLEPGVRHDHVEDRLSGFSDRIPHADRLEQSAAGSDDGGGARIAARSVRQRRIGHHNRDIRAKTLPQRQRQRQACERAAADDNAPMCRHDTPYSLAPIL